MITWLQNDLQQDSSLQGDVSLGEGESKDLERDTHSRKSQSIPTYSTKPTMEYDSSPTGNKVMVKAKPATLHLHVCPPQISAVSPSHPSLPHHDQNSHPRNLPDSALLDLALSPHPNLSPSTIVEGKQNKHFYYPLRNEETEVKACRPQGDISPKAQTFELQVQTG